MLKKNHTIVLVLTLVLLAGCTPATVPDAQGRLYYDDFSSRETRWPQSEDELGLTDYEDGAYRIRVDEPSYYLWGLTGEAFDDVRLEVDVETVSAVEGGEAGVICRFQDVDNYYFFILRPDGSYAALKMQAGELQIMYMDQDAAIQTGAAANHLSVTCVGEELSYSVNDVQLVEITDADFPEGDVGLIAGTNADGGMDARFDEFEVYPAVP
ncbi:MAG: hypothetical protein JXB38_22355 [Anaerolineales bacterium]|nr:hypothetical protein [Anaerolineales bacterium]